jgi:tRNA threonylcarbamoyladenosine biosynthesis protein TsaB
MLAFDTATPVVTVALHDGTRVLSGETAAGARRHGELLAAMIERVLAAGGVGRTDLEAIAVGTGPGPYTGLRAGVVTARVLASALRIPAVGVCTLDVMARAAAQAAAGREFVVAADARRKEVYWARYAPTAQRIAGPAVGPPDAVVPGDAAESGGWPIVPVTGGSAGHPPCSSVGLAARGRAAESCPVAGEGPVLYPELFPCPIPPRYPDAADLAEIAVRRLAEHDPPGPPEPLYLRRPDAREPGPPKRVTAGTAS